MAKPQHPWVERNLREGIYNIADENIRYFYNNWVPLLASQEDRTVPSRAGWRWKRGWRKSSPAVLEKGSDRQRRVLLAGLTEYPSAPRPMCTIPRRTTSKSGAARLQPHRQ